MEKFFESERICYSEVSVRLIQDYLVMVNDIEHVEKYLGGAHEPYTEAQEIAWVRRKLEEKAPVFSMIEKDGGDFIGTIELNGVTAFEGELGIAITANKQNLGYGTEAVAALTRYAFEQLGLRRVWLRTHPENARAIRVYQKCGFTQFRKTDTHIFMEYLK